MNVERAPGGTSLIDVLDRILDKGIAFDPWVRANYGWRLDLSNSQVVAQTFTPPRPTFGSHASSESAWPVNNDDDDDGSGGSSGAPAVLHIELEPRRRPPGAPRRTGRKA